MPEITPSFVMQYERRMRAITESEYTRRLASDNIWWNKVCRPMSIEGKTERMTWFLETATIEPIGPTGTGSVDYESMVTQTAEYPTFRHGRGIKVQRDQLEDLDGTGLNQLATWSENIGNEIAYYPQVLMAQLILNGANTDGSANAYDGVPYFADSTTSRTIGGVSVKGHPYNPYKPMIGGYSNWLKGSAATVTQPNGATYAYPGALPIGESVTADVALANLAKAWTYISSIKMPNGRDPRFLTPEFVFGPPALAPRLAQLHDAKFLAQASSSGGGSADVIAYISKLGLGTPVIAQELQGSISYSAPMPFMGSGGNVRFAKETMQGSDTSYYIVCKEQKTTQLGGLLYVSRKPFKVNYYTGDSGGTAMSAELERANEFEYLCQGRMSGQYGHPYTIFRVDAQ